MSFTIFHQVERYHVAREVIACLRGGKKSCRILEVGAGRHGNSARYFPDDEILFTDLIYTADDLVDPRFMNADATDLPFADNAFDFVIGLDVLEHISPEKRTLMLQEVFRVAKIGAFLSWPHEPDQFSHDPKLEAIYRFHKQIPPVWLNEHDEMGLPKFEDVHQAAMQLASQEHIFTAHAVDNELNRMLLRLEAHTSCNPALTKLFIDLNNVYTETILVKDLGCRLETAVKSYLVLTKQSLAEETRESLQAVFEGFDAHAIADFKKSITDQFVQWMRTTAISSTEDCETMSEQNTMTVMLEVMDKLDQMMAKLDQQGNAKAQQAVDEREIQQQILNGIKEANTTSQVNSLVKSAEQNAAQQQQILNGIKEANITRQANSLVKSAEQNAAQQQQMAMELKCAITEEQKKVEEAMFRQLQAVQAIRDDIKQETQRKETENNKIVLNVILITYNQEKYIKTTLQSILDQKTDFRFNILVADDCSKDKTVKIIREMEKQTDIPFVYLDNSHNRGIMQNYKRAFAACDAEYVAIMEGDDIWVDPYRLQKHKNFLETHLECSMSFNQYIVKDFKKGTSQVQPILTHANNDTYRILSGHDLAYDNLIGNFSTCVYKNAYLQRLPQQLYDVHAYDWLTNIFIAQMGYVGLLLQPMSIYRIHSGGIWSQKKQQDKLKEIINLTIVYDELTEHEFTLGFTAHRMRLEEQLRQLEVPVPEVVEPVAEVSVVTPRKGFKHWVKKVIIKSRFCLYKVLDCLPPIVTTVLKWIIPPAIVRKINNVRED